MTHADALDRLDKALADLESQLRLSGAGALDATCSTDAFDLAALLARRSTEDAQLAAKAKLGRDAARVSADVLKPR